MNSNRKMSGKPNPLQHPLALTVGYPAAVLIGAYIMKPKMIMDPTDSTNTKISNARLAILAAVVILAGQLANCQLNTKKNLNMSSFAG